MTFHHRLLPLLPPATTSAHHPALYLSNMRGVGYSLLQPVMHRVEHILGPIRRGFPNTFIILLDPFHGLGHRYPRPRRVYCLDCNVQITLGLP